MTDRIDPERWAVTPGFHDVSGRWHETPPETVSAILDSMGATPGGPPDPWAVTVRTDHPMPPVGAGRIRCEDGAEIDTAGPIPPDIPLGYHRFEPASGERPYPLVVSPGRVPRPFRRSWGFAAQLYATRSRRSWGIGDLSDLSELGAWAAGLGAGFTLLNPLHAATPGTPLPASPYYPGSRCFMNPLYIAVEEVPGAAEYPGTGEAAAAGRSLNRERLIDRDRVWALKSPVLEGLYAGFRADDGFERFRIRRGQPLERFATFCAVAEVHGSDWRNWPEGAASAAGAERVRYHQWLQWILDEQLERANSVLGLITDLAVGVDPGGPDAWMWQDCFPPGMRIGAPPDEFNTAGQDWGLPPFDPWRLRSAGYGPWIEALRAGLAHGAGLRVDHVMGLFRLYWIPQGGDARRGAYVRYPHHDLLNILALEADRAGAHVVGEDLGTVEDEVRRDLAERQVLSYRVWWFEERPTDQWPEAAMGAVTTHDLPTVAGVLSGSDLEAQRRIGMEPNEESSQALLHKLERGAGASEGSRPEDVVSAVYEDLGRTPCLLLTATLEDVLAVEERPNMPGTTDSWPNWCIALPVPLEDLSSRPLAAEVARHLEGHDRS